MIKEKKGAILIISGPSGCGKSTLLKEFADKRTSVMAEAEKLSSTLVEKLTK